MAEIKNLEEKLRAYKAAWEEKSQLQKRIKKGVYFDTNELNMIISGNANTSLVNKAFESGLTKDDFEIYSMCRKICSEFEQEVMEHLHNYMCKMISDYCTSCPVNFDDALQAMMEKIVKHLHEYETDYALTTFFVRHFKHALRSTLHDSTGSISDYYGSTLTLINRIERYLKENKIDVNENTIYEYAPLVIGKELSITTIKNTLRQRKHLSHKELNNEVDFDASNIGTSPEEEFIHLESLHELAKAFEPLPKLEKLCFCMLYGIELPKKTAKQIAIDPYIISLCKERGIETKIADLKIKSNVVTTEQVAESIVTRLVNSAKKELMSNPLIVATYKDQFAPAKKNVFLITENISAKPSQEVLSNVALVCEIDVDD